VSTLEIHKLPRDVQFHEEPEEIYDPLGPMFEVFDRSWAVLRRNPLTLLGIATLMLVFVLCLIGPTLAPYDPVTQDMSAVLQAPSLKHWMGTDALGRDVLSRVLVGTRYSVPTGIVVVTIAMGLGLLIGAPAGFVGGWTDEILMRFTDLFLAFPALILAMAIAGALGPSLPNALAAIAIAWWPAYARLVRGQVMAARSSQYVEAARCVGASPSRILCLHILPNCIGPLIVQATLDLGSVILTAAGLSFIGFGAQPPLPEWGAMINSGRLYIASHWWVATFPGLAVLGCVMGFNLLGDGLRDMLDPRSVR
jgi:peptide/nickel transport system permease protein